MYDTFAKQAQTNNIKIHILKFLCIVQASLFCAKTWHSNYLWLVYRAVKMIIGNFSKFCLNFFQWSIRPFCGILELFIHIKTSVCMYVEFNVLIKWLEDNAFNRQDRKFKLEFLHYDFCWWCDVDKAVLVF